LSLIENIKGKDIIYLKPNGKKTGLSTYACGQNKKNTTNFFGVIINLSLNQTNEKKTTDSVFCDKLYCVHNCVPHQN
jgi:hypothetical protein